MKNVKIPSWLPKLLVFDFIGWNTGSYFNQIDLLTFLIRTPLIISRFTLNKEERDMKKYIYKWQ